MRGGDFLRREFLKITFETIEIPNIQYPITNNFSIESFQKILSPGASKSLRKTFAIYIKGNKSVSGGSAEIFAFPHHAKDPQNIEHKP